MSKENKTALDLACKYIVKLEMSLHSNDSYIQPNYCKKNKCNPKSEIYCFDCCRQYLQEQADIPDGWDVVKEIYEWLEEHQKRIYKRAKEEHSVNELLNSFWDGREIEVDCILENLYKRLQQKEIEVK